MGKKTFIVISVFLCFSLWGKPTSHKTICLNMIVKNEGLVIEKWPGLVETLIDYWVIVDTGSTDGTQKVIKNFLKDVPGELHERPWINFAHNRMKR